MYAIIETGGKQIKVEEGQAIYIEKLDAEAGETFTFDKVLFVGGEDVKVGAHSLKALLLQLKLKNKADKRKLLFSNIKRKRTTVINKVTVNHTQKLLLKKSTLNW